MAKSETELLRRVRFGPSLRLTAFGGEISESEKLWSRGFFQSRISMILS